MTGPMPISDPAHTPVRGDLAHVNLAGRYFVPHYAVPLPRVAGPRGTELRAAARSDAEVLQALAAGTPFAVLDMAGAWAWGQAEDESGPVGYVALADLENAS